jgi:hypothetical protein
MRNTFSKGANAEIEIILPLPYTCFNLLAFYGAIIYKTQDFPL